MPTCTPANAPAATPDRGQQTLVTQYPLPYSIPQSQGTQPTYNQQPAYQPVGNQPQQPYTGASYNNIPIYEAQPAYKPQATYVQQPPFHGQTSQPIYNPPQPTYPEQSPYNPPQPTYTPEEEPQKGL